MDDHPPGSPSPWDHFADTLIQHPPTLWIGRVYRTADRSSWRGLTMDSVGTPQHINRSDSGFFNLPL